jgi:hypothetical protein
MNHRASFVLSMEADAFNEQQQQPPRRRSSGTAAGQARSSDTSHSSSGADDLADRFSALRTPTTTSRQSLVLLEEGECGVGARGSVSYDVDDQKRKADKVKEALRKMQAASIQQVCLFVFVLVCSGSFSRHLVTAHHQYCPHGRQ